MSLNPNVRPTFALTVSALRTTDPRFPWIGPTPEEDDAAAALEAIETDHRGDSDESDENLNWGHCLTCGTWWPCEAWIEGEFLAVQFLGRAGDRVVKRARSIGFDMFPQGQAPAHDSKETA